MITTNTVERSPQWNLFIDTGLILTEDIDSVFIGLHNDGGGDCFFLSILQHPNVLPKEIVTVSDLKSAICTFILTCQYEICYNIFVTFRDRNDNKTFSEFVESIRKPYEYTCPRTIIITSLFLQTDIIVVSNELSAVDGSQFTGLFKSSAALVYGLGIENPKLLITNEEKIYLYHHLSSRPLQPALTSHLDHFCSLKKRPRTLNDFIIPLRENILVNGYIINNGINDNDLSRMPIKRNEELETKLGSDF